MKPEKQKLLHDLLDDDSRREATLFAGGRILRRRRYGRIAVRTSAVLILLAIAALCLPRKAGYHAPSQTVASATTQSPAIQVRALSDDELLALFPNTPVGLAKTSDGRKHLIFPRPGDEQRFIKRL
jgi:hypothetical protein